MNSFLVSILLTSLSFAVFFIISFTDVGLIDISELDQYPLFDYNHKGAPTNFNSFTIGQHFLASQNNLNRVDLLFGDHFSKNSEKLVFHVREINTNSDIVVFPKTTDQIIPNKMTSFSFEPILDSINREYYFFIEYPNGGQEGRTRLWIDTNDDYKYSNMLINEKEIKGDILFKPYYKVSIGYFFNELIDRISIYSHIQNFNLIFYVLSIFLVFLFFVVFLKLVNIKKIKIT